MNGNYFPFHVFLPLGEFIFVGETLRIEMYSIFDTVGLNFNRLISQGFERES